MKNESDSPRQVCLPCTSRAELTIYLKSKVLCENQYRVPSAAARSEAEKTIFEDEDLPTHRIRQVRSACPASRAQHPHAIENAVRRPTVQRMDALLPITR
jgi:hypothetical protein